MPQKKNRILVVDGSTVSRQILSRILQDEMTGIDVDSCKNAEEAQKKRLWLTKVIISTPCSKQRVVPTTGGAMPPNPHNLL